MTMKMKMALQVSAALLFVLVWVSIPAFATGNQNHECQGGHNCNEEGGPINVEAEAQSEAAATAESTSGATATATNSAEGGSGGDGGEGGTANATNEGITVDASDSSSVENNSSNIVLVPNNNTESCLRVIGFAWGKNGESGALGYPYRSKKCDFEGAADDAFAAGERELGWFWKCQNPNLYKTFKDKNETKDQASQQCLDKMVGGVTAIKTITALTEQLRTSEEERSIARRLHKESKERITEACNESKNRILESCMNSK